MLVGISPRIYQETILATASTKNTIVVLPTGMGKTLIAIMLAAHRITLHPNSKVLMVTPTKPLAEQHYQTFQHHLPQMSYSLFTGNIKPQKRAEDWNKSQIIISTPQGLENDIINKAISLNTVSLLIIDEAHRAVGNYAYVYLAKEYIKTATWPRILALTASPGEKIETLNEVCQNLGIENVELRTTTDPDVKPYLHHVEINWEFVDLPPQIIEIKVLLEECCHTKLKQIKELGYTNTTQLHKGELIALQKHLFAEIATNKEPDKLSAISTLAQALKIQHGLELLETQGLTQLLTYFQRLDDESHTTKIKAVKNLVSDPLFREALTKTRICVNNGIIHPKLPKIVNLVEDIIKKKPLAKIIIFTQFRETGTTIVNAIENKGIRATLFVGQAKKAKQG